MPASGPDFDAHLALAQWLSLSGDAAAALPVPEPARALLDATTAVHGDLLVAAVGEIADVVQRDPRWPVILRERVITRRTLDSIGADLDLTRERVRQLEAALREELASGPLTGLVVDGLRRRIHPFTHVADVLAAVPCLLEPIPDTGVNLLDVVEAVAPDWSLVGCGWLVADGAADRVDAVLREFADDTGAADVAAVAGVLGVDAGLLADYLSTVGCRFLFRGHVLTRDRSIGDRALAVLTLADGPMTTAQLAELIPGRTKPSIRNALGAEPRIVRSAPDTWTVAGREDRNPVNHARPEMTPGMYVHQGRWSLLVDVDDATSADVSYEIPHAIPALLDATFDVPVNLPGELGPKSVRWRRQGAVGTSIADHLAEGSHAGGRVRVIVEKYMETVGVPPTTGHGPWATVFSAMGLGDPPADQREALSVVAEAIGLPADAPHCSVAARLELRGQFFVAECLADALAQGYTLEP
ncbi:hypothetical protein [Corynebacterium xerosis]|uniref:RNA polymerase sigma-70 region 4 domain-containing protein n=1 Tax=Corynebacterium xerosis TaxID=1725 RepID=A0A7X9XS88_9CORY|nr:hypothetical protein [Corynebacterium xerosis]NMF08417.1 hypothetical protein [Corynebacterium xerosis]